MNDKKKLCKSKNNRMLSGCLAGVAEYLGWDPTVVRIAYVLITIFSAAFPGIILYLAMVFIMPDSNE